MGWTVERGARSLPGRLEVHPSFGALRRRVWVWTPPGHDAGREVPLLVFQDGQNLFLDRLAAAGSWHAAETLAALAADGHPVVAVAVANAETGRIHEYSPFADRRHGGGGADAYLDRLIGEVLPAVGERWRVTADPARTTLVGSSLGGVLALYGVLRHPDVFGRAAALSPSCWFAARGLRRFVAHAAPAAAAAGSRIYLDVGRRERAGQLRDRRTLGFWSRRYTADVRHVRRLLTAGGFGDEALRYVEDPAGRHAESAWARRLPRALRFLLR